MFGRVGLFWLLLQWPLSRCLAANLAPLSMFAVKDQLRAEGVSDILRKSKSAEIRTFMNTSVQPCENFYEFACGNWDNINPALVDAKTGIFTVLANAFNRKIMKLLQYPKMTNESEMKRKVQYFYESCLTTSDNLQSHRIKLIEIMEEFGGMPVLKREEWNASAFNWLEVSAKILRKYGKQIIVGVDIAPDLKNNQVNRLYVGQLDEFVPSKSSEFYSSLALLWSMEMKKILGLDPFTAHHAATALAAFEKSLAEGMTTPQEGLSMDEITRLRLLDDMSQQYHPHLNLSHFVSVWLGHDYKVPVYEYGLKYFENLHSLIAKTDKKVVGNYLMWKLMAEFRFDFETEKEKHTKRCVEATKRYFVKYMDFMVYEDLLKNNKANINELQKMWLRLKKSFREILRHSETLQWNEFTQQKALEKLEAMKLVINSYETEDFNKEFGELVISTSNYFENVIKILQVRGRNYLQKLNEPPKIEEGELLNFSPAYAAEHNSVYIPVAFLQPRFLWDNVYPVALKYATLGYVIAHEMAHGFDDTIRKFDAKGNLVDWWDPKSLEVFKQKKTCLMEQFTKFKFNGLNLPKQKNQGENIADNVGIRIAFRSYEDWLAEQAHPQESLPNLAYADKQLFFIGNAQIWCTDINRRIKHLIVATDVHAPEEIRVLAMYANFDEFAREYNCQLDSKMHPISKCTIY